MIICNENRAQASGMKFQALFEFSIITSTLKLAGFSEDKLRKAFERGLSDEFSEKIGLKEVKS